MAQLSQEQLKQLLDRGLTLSQVQQIASKRGDTVPGPTILGAIAQPFYTASLRLGQIAGKSLATALGGDPERAQKAFEEARVQKFPFLGTLATEGQKPLTTQRGRDQALGLGLEVGSSLIPIGRLSRALSPAVGKTFGTAASLGIAGYGIETGYKLEQGEENAFSPGLGTAIPAGIPIAGKVLSGVAPTFRYGIAKTTGLNQETVKLALTKPQALQDAQKEGLNRLNLAELLNERVKTLTDEVSEAGAKYDPIRNSGQVVTFTENPIQKVLNKYKLTISNGAVRVSPESPPLSNGDITALERFIAQFGEQQQYSANAFLNARQGLDVMAKWQQGLDKTASIKNIARDLRQEFDAVGKKTIKGLKEVDEEFAPVRSELGKIRKEYLELRDGKWQLKDSAMSRIANATNLGRDKVLQRLEQYVPGITQQIQLVKALEDLARASDGRNVGAYLPSILLGGGALTALSNPITAALAAMVALPQVAIPILIAFGKLNGIAQSVMRALVGKLLVGKTLTEQELLIYKNAIINHLNQISPGDQFFSSPTGKRVTEYLGELNRNPRLGLQLEDVSKKDGFKGFTDLSTKLLEKLKGRTTVSRQFIEDLSNSPDLKQAERDLIRNTLKDEGDQISVPDFANKVKSELLPLKMDTTEGVRGMEATAEARGSRYENITLPDELRGPVANYSERVYESPISTSAGDVHFSGDGLKNYFAHTRIEDLPDNKTRRVIEAQSDLFQKGRLESEKITDTHFAVKGNDVIYKDKPYKILETQNGRTFATLQDSKGNTLNNVHIDDLSPVDKQNTVSKRDAEIAKLEPYRNTWHERVIREEVKKAAQDGKTKLQFPTGETAMKIEGLGERAKPFIFVPDKTKPHITKALNIEDLKVGQQIQENADNSFSSWIITDVLGDGKFKAVPQSSLKNVTGETVAEKIRTGQLSNYEESFDISGKVDTENPIYKFYEKEVGKYLKNKYGATLVTDPQGVKWWEVQIKPEMKKLPIEAFGVGAVPLLTQNEDE